MNKYKEMDSSSLKKELYSLENIYYTETSRRIRLSSVSEDENVYDYIYKKIVIIKKILLERDMELFKLRYGDYSG